MSSPVRNQRGQNESDKKNVKKVETKADHLDDDTLCGIWIFKPPVLQPFAKIGFFAAFFSMAAFTTTTLTSYVNSQVTTLERQFGFSSSQTGIILAANDIGYLVCVLFVGYTTTRVHIPRSLGIAAIIYGISGLACALPHFLFGASLNLNPSEDRSNRTKTRFDSTAVFGTLCDLFNSTQDSCQLEAERKADNRLHYVPERIAEISLVIIVIGMALQGFGKAPRMAFSVTYVDDNTSKVKTGFYMGSISAVAFTGPAVAYLVGGFFSRTYVTLEDTTLTPRHPKWIGAWWLGYVVFGAFAIAVSVPLFCFPRRMPRKKFKEDDNIHRAADNLDSIINIKTSRKANEYAADVSNDTEDHKTSTARRFRLKLLLRHVKDFLATMYRLVTNPVYVCIVLSACFTIFMLSGSSSFTAKYYERMFNLPAHTANYIIAGQEFCTVGVGTFIGGYMSRRLKMTAMGGVKWNLAVIGIAFLAQLTCLAFQCEQPTVYNWPSEEITCNKGCNCPDDSYFPICGDDGRTYYSPCLAGCVQVEEKVYQNCTCITGGHARSGTCDYFCPQLYGLVVFMGMRALFSTLVIIPKMIVFIRCVSLQDRPMALAFSTFMTALLGWLVGPVVFGRLIDGVCLVWDIKCGTRGRCLLYDNNGFRLNFIGIMATGLFCAVFCITLAYLYARYTKCLDEPPQGQNGLNTAEMTLVVNGVGNGFTSDEAETLADETDNKMKKKDEEADKNITLL